MFYFPDLHEGIFTSHYQNVLSERQQGRKRLSGKGQGRANIVYNWLWEENYSLTWLQGIMLNPPKVPRIPLISKGQSGAS